MITLLATLAWGQTTPEPVEPEHRGNGGRVALGVLEGALIGGAGGVLLGMGAAWLALETAQPGEGCDRTAAGLMPIGGMTESPWVRSSAAPSRRTRRNAARSSSPCRWFDRERLG